jgi:sulfate transport system substrate-binding protein
MKSTFIAAGMLGAMLAIGCSKEDSQTGRAKLLNVSYDPTRELWAEMNKAFQEEYNAKHDTQVEMLPTSNAASGSQARSVIEGAEADVVTLAMWTDIDAIREAGLINEGWEDRLPNRSLPYYSTIVFVVRKGNPKQIKDWPDLVREDVEIVTPSPKTSGNGKLSFLGAWASVTQRGGSREDAIKFISDLYHNVKVLDTGARAATTTFAQKKIGDVHLTWENEALLEVKQSDGELELVYPKISVRAEPKVAIVDANVKRHNTTEVAEEYLKFVYTPAGQEIVAKNFYRPIDADVLAKHRDSFPDLELASIEQISGDWQKAQDDFFSDGGVFDQVFERKNK